MTEKKKEEEFNPWQAYFMIGAGLCLLAVKFISDNNNWSTVDFLKVGVGVAMIGFGGYRLIRKK